MVILKLGLKKYMRVKSNIRFNDSINRKYTSVTNTTCTMKKKNNNEQSYRTIYKWKVCTFYICVLFVSLMKGGGELVCFFLSKVILVVTASALVELELSRSHIRDREPTRPTGQQPV